MAAVAIARFSLDLRADRPPTLSVNGVDVAGIVGLTMRCVPPGLPQLVLELTGEGTIDGEGIVALAAEAGDEIAYLRSFLANLDAGQLEAAALAQFDAGAETNGQAFLRALSAMVGPA